jgi:hypothetical protein
MVKPFDRDLVSRQRRFIADQNPQSSLQFRVGRYLGFGGNACGLIPVSSPAASHDKLVVCNTHVVCIDQQSYQRL